MITNWSRALLVCVLTLALLAPSAAFAQGGHGGHETGNGDDTQMSEETAEMMESIEELRQLSGREFEIGYINRIIPHHEGALDMAEMLVNDAPHKEVREAAARIIEDQRREIRELTDFLHDTYNEEVDPDERQMMDHSMMMPMHENPGSEMAEKIFLLMMREHHQTAVEMGQIVLERAQSEELLEQARGMVQSQREEQEQFAEWLEEWYGIEAPEPMGDMMAAAQLAMGETQMPEAGAGGMARSARGNEALPIVAALALLALVVGAHTLRRRLT
ncbi:MAG: DUF305 domain-containing protein [Chloroflexota bacterium]|nr:DUF305 domain-containing protein [Chloroflexota bacterium]